MIRILVLFLIWTLFVQRVPQLHAATRLCTTELGPAIPTIDPDPLQKIRSDFEITIEQYQERLGIHWNPFLTFAIFDPKEAEKLWVSLTKSSKKQPIQKILDMVLQRASVHPSHRDKYTPPLNLLSEHHRQIHQFLDDTRIEASNILAFQANLIAAKLALDFVDSLRPQIDEQNSQNLELTPEPEDSLREKENKARQKKSETDPARKPRYPRLSKIYPPPGLSSDSENNSTSKKSSTQLQQFNFESPYLRIKDYVLLTRSPLSVAEMDLFDSPPALKSGRSDKFTIVFPQGETNLELIVPDGYHPLQPTDRRIRIHQTSSGSFHLQTTEVMEKIEIYLEPLPPSKHPPNPLEKRVLTQTMGIQSSEWPAPLQDLLAPFSQSGIGGNELKLAQLLEKHLRDKYLYNRKTPPDMDPAIALAKGEFACFQAAVTMAEILRSYGIPTKVVAGFRGQKWKKKIGDIWTYVTDSGEAHAWISAFINGEWRRFDGTPSTISPNDDSPRGPNEYETMGPNDQPPESSPEAGDDGTKTDSNETYDSSQKEWLEKITAQIRDRTSAHRKEQNAKPENEEDQAPNLSREDLIRELTVGSLDLDSEKIAETNPLITRVQRLFLRYLIQPSQSGARIHSQLPIVEAIIKNSPTPELAEILAGIKKNFEGHRPQMSDWLQQIVNGFEEQGLNDTYRKLSQVFSQFELFARTLEGNSRIEAMLFLKELNDIFRGFQPLLHAKAQDLGAIEEFIETLPALVRNAILRNYGLSSIGVNEPSLRLAEDFKNGNLADYRLIAMLNSVSDFIMDGVPHPQGTRIISWERNPLLPYGQDPLPVVRAQDYFRGRPLQNHLSRLENFAQKTLMGMQTRQDYLIQDEDSEDESERVTYIFIDGSTSMEGVRMKFLRGLVKSFSAKVGSDVTEGPNPRLRHRMVIVIFTDVLHLEQLVVLDTQEKILGFIDGTTYKIPPPNGGTDIQNALVQGLGQIAAYVESGERRKRPVAAVNILLISDGESNVQYDPVRNAREAIGREIPVQMMFVSLAGNNPTLKTLAQDSKQMGTEISFYRDFEESEMASYLQSSETPPLSKSNTFFSNHKSSDLDSTTLKKLMSLPRMLLAFERHYRANEGLRSLTAEKLLHGLETHSSRRSDPPEKSKVYLWLQDLRGFLYPARKFLASERQGNYGPWADRIAVDLQTNLPILTGRTVDELSIAEIETLKHYLRFLHAPE